MSASTSASKKRTSEEPEEDFDEIQEKPKTKRARIAELEEDLERERSRRRCTEAKTTFLDSHRVQAPASFAPVKPDSLRATAQRALKLLLTAMVKNRTNALRLVFADQLCGTPFRKYYLEDETPKEPFHVACGCSRSGSSGEQKVDAKALEDFFQKTIYPVYSSVFIQVFLDHPAIASSKGRPCVCVNTVLKEPIDDHVVFTHDLPLFPVTNELDIENLATYLASMEVKAHSDHPLHIIGLANHFSGMFPPDTAFIYHSYDEVLKAKTDKFWSEAEAEKLKTDSS